jgi:hypothetical protein
MEKMGPPMGRFGRAFTVLSFSIFESPFLIVMDGVVDIRRWRTATEICVIDGPTGRLGPSHLRNPLRTYVISRFSRSYFPIADGWSLALNRLVSNG